MSVFVRPVQTLVCVFITVCQKYNIIKMHIGGLASVLTKLVVSIDKK